MIDETKGRTSVATVQPVKFTYEDYRTAPPDKRYELLDGDLVMVPAPNLKHQDVQSRLGRRLAQFIEERALGMFFFAPATWSSPTPTSCSRTFCSSPGNAIIC